MGSQQVQPHSPGQRGACTWPCCPCRGSQQPQREGSGQPGGRGPAESLATEHRLAGWWFSHIWLTSFLGFFCNLTEDNGQAVPDLKNKPLPWAQQPPPTIDLPPPLNSWSALWFYLPVTCSHVNLCCLASAHLTVKTTLSRKRSVPTSSSTRLTWAST